MLDYYDRCYDRELEQHGDGEAERLLGSVELGFSSAAEAAAQLLANGIMQAEMG
jgi:hypothetical protein